MIIFDSLSPVLGSSPVSDSPLEVSLRVGLNEGVDWANPSLGVVGGGSVSPTSTTSSSSSSGLYTPEEGLSPASSESSGSTR